MGEINTKLEKEEHALIHVPKELSIPLFGLDFLGILDRGTNVLEIKPITICNLHCKYCFVSAGDYSKNFITEIPYLMEWIKRAIELKKCDDIEIHLAPYGEIFTFPHLVELITELRNIPEVKIISMQTNGLLLNSKIIKKIEEAGLDRLNISLNSMDAEQCAHLCGVKKYDLSHLLNIFELVLQSKMELLIAPVWFMGINDQGILDIIEYVKKKEEEGYQWPKLRIGIQNYLSYKTGRRISKAKSRDFSYFYQKLREFEKKYNLKLKLGPLDFNIHKTEVVNPPVKLNESGEVDIVADGRWKHEYIALLNQNWAVKVLSKIPLKPGQKVRVNFVKSSLTGNLLTGRPH